MGGADTQEHHAARRWLTSIAFAAAGAALLAWLIHRSHPAQLWRAFEVGAAWLPVTIAIEGIRLVIEASGTRKLYEARIRFAVLFRATVVTYAVEMLAPGGRATGEAVRAAMLRRRTRLADTAAAATTIETASLLALAAWSLATAGVALPVSLPFSGVMALQAVAVVVVALVVSGVARTDFLARILGRVWPRARAALEKVRGRARAQRLRSPFVAFVASRGLELVQYAVLLVAVTGRLSAPAAVLAFGVATVAGSVGDSVPAQLGILDAGLVAAAPVLGFTPEDALAISLLAHGHQIVWSAVGLVVPLVWRVSPEDDSPSVSDSAAGPRTPTAAE